MLTADGQAMVAFARGGQRHAMGVADKEPPPRRLLEAPNMLADRRLAQG